MSRSNPNVNAPNPAVRWFEWNGEHGTVRYYDKDTKKNIDLPSGFTFLLLDELAGVGGWHNTSDSGIYSNAVRDTSKDVLVVKSFKGGPLAEGLYRSIKDRVAGEGGHFVALCYVAAKVGDKLSICGLKFKGITLKAWMDFRKANRNALYQEAVQIVGFEEGKKGRIVYRFPKFALKPVSPETDADAVRLDQELQDWLEGYLQRKTRDQAEDETQDDDSDYDDTPAPGPDMSEPLTDDDIPFAWLLPFLPAALAAHTFLA